MDFIKWPIFPFILLPTSHYYQNYITFQFLSFFQLRIFLRDAQGPKVDIIRTDQYWICTDLSDFFFVQCSFNIIIYQLNKCIYLLDRQHWKKSFLKFEASSNWTPCQFSWSLIKVCCIKLLGGDAIRGSWDSFFDY